MAVDERQPALAPPVEDGLVGKRVELGLVDHPEAAHAERPAVAERDLRPVLDEEPGARDRICEGAGGHGLGLEGRAEVAGANGGSGRGIPFEQRLPLPIPQARRGLVDADRELFLLRVLDQDERVAPRIGGDVRPGRPATIPLDIEIFPVAQADDGHGDGRIARREDDGVLPDRTREFNRVQRDRVGLAGEPEVRRPEPLSGMTPAVEWPGRTIEQRQAGRPRSQAAFGRQRPIGG